MALPNSEQYIRGLALENATRIVASPNFRLDPEAPISEMDVIIDLANKFADYITNGHPGSE